MRNPFDRQIAETMRKELGSIKASDDLIARTLARVNSEKADKESNGPITHLSALNMGYIRQQEKNRERHNRRVSRIVICSLATAAALCVTINLLSFFKSNPADVAVATSKAELTASVPFAGSSDDQNVITGSGTVENVDYSQYIYVNDTSAAGNIYMPTAGRSNPGPEGRFELSDNYRNGRHPSGYRVF